MKQKLSRRRVIGGAVAVGAAANWSRTLAQTGRVRNFDHVALPMQNTAAMPTFYRALGFQVSENAASCSVYFCDNMINFHRPATWQRESFALRAPAAKPPCGDLCFVWEGSPDGLKAMLDRAGAMIIEGPVARQGGRRKGGSSVYIRDPDGNLLEFIIYL